MNGDANRTECAFVDTWLDDWTAGNAPAAVARRLETHVATCERCARLAALVRDATGNADPTGDTEDLLPAVLQLTTGSPCARAESLLPALVDGELDADSREILEGHLAGCEPCSQLLAALRDARAVLPALAEMEPPPGFAASVLRATSGAPARAAWAPRVPARVSAFGQWWLRFLARPRASLEIAYVATVLLVVLFGNPVAAFHEAEARAGQLANTPVGGMTADVAVKQAATGAIERLIAPFVAAANAVANELTERWRQARALMDAIASRVGVAIDWVATLDLREIFNGLRAPSRGQPAAGQPTGTAQPAGRR